MFILVGKGQSESECKWTNLISWGPDLNKKWVEEETQRRKNIALSRFSQFQSGTKVFFLLCFFHNGL